MRTPRRIAYRSNKVEMMVKMIDEIILVTSFGVPRAAWIANSHEWEAT
jgi:hypothetical protein